MKQRYTNLNFQELFLTRNLTRDILFEIGTINCENQISCKSGSVEEAIPISHTEWKAQNSG